MPDVRPPALFIQHVHAVIVAALHTAGSMINPGLPRGPVFSPKTSVNHPISTGYQCAPDASSSILADKPNPNSLAALGFMQASQQQQLQQLAASQLPPGHLGRANSAPQPANAAAMLKSKGFLTALKPAAVQQQAGLAANWHSHSSTGAMAIPQLQSTGITSGGICELARQGSVGSSASRGSLRDGPGDSQVIHHTQLCSASLPSAYDSTASPLPPDADTAAEASQARLDQKKT
jgi:hypothetical protein